MARIRTVKPQFFAHEALSELAAETHLLAAALLTYADDDGYFNANPKLVQAACCPLRECAVSVQDSLTTLASIGWLRLGTGEDGRRYGHIVNFSKHQRINRKTDSKVPELRIEWEDAQSPHDHLTRTSHTSHTHLSEVVTREGKGKGTGEEGNVSAEGSTKVKEGSSDPARSGPAEPDPFDIPAYLLRAGGAA